MFVVFNVWSFMYFYFGYCVLKIVGILVYIFGLFECGVIFNKYI